MTINRPYPADVEFRITRTLDAPRQAVFEAWSQADQLAQWWGPKGLSVRVNALDFKPGGVFHYAMGLPTGQDMWGIFHYGDIVAPETIVFVNSFSDRDQNITRAPFSPTWPLEVYNTLTLTEENGKTVLDLRGGPIHADMNELQTFKMGHASMEMGFGGTFEQLTAYLAKLSTS